MKNHQDNTSALSALLRTANGGDTLETNSLCCAAAGIIAPLSATAEALIPHEKLRGAALADATLNAQERPLAQLAEGGKAFPRSNIAVAEKPVSLTKVIKKAVNHTEDMSYRERIYTIRNHEYRRIIAERITRSRDSGPSGHGGKPNGSRLDLFIGITIRREMLERVRYFTAGTEARANGPQIYLKILHLRLASFLISTPDGALRFGSTMPNPITNMESRESSIDCKIARSRESICSFRNVTALQLAYLPIQLQQHVIDASHLKRMHRSFPFCPNFERYAPPHRRGIRLNQYPPSITSMSHDSCLWRQEI